MSCLVSSPKHSQHRKVQQEIARLRPSERADAWQEAELAEAKKQCPLKAVQNYRKSVRQYDKTFTTFTDMGVESV